MADMPCGGIRLFHCRTWCNFRQFSPLATSSCPIQQSEQPKTAARSTDIDKSKASYYPKRGRKLSLAFKGKGICKVADTGFVLMCDRALPGEKFMGRIPRKKDNYAEV